MTTKEYLPGFSNAFMPRKENEAMKHNTGIRPLGGKVADCCSFGMTDTGDDSMLYG